jgi:uncharacterized surface protein with fasciclin (FAS1) repeats
MVSYHGYWDYQNLYQSFDLTDIRRFPEKEKFNNDSVFGYLHGSSNFTIFSHIVKTANLAKKTDDPQFNSTLFICDDETLRQKYGEAFFMNLDRNSALAIIQNNMLNRLIHKKTLLSNNGCFIQTKREETQVFVEVDKDNIYLDGKKIISSEISRSNGLIYILDDLLLPCQFC